jgi:hypothetical protein
VSFSLLDGKRQWETWVERRSDPGDLKIAAGERTIFVLTGSALHGLSASDGHLLWSVGWGLGH